MIGIANPTPTKPSQARSGQRRTRVAVVLEIVGRIDAAPRKLKTFSGSMKRRVGIAQALLADPQLLIVDESTAGLDPEERIRFRNLLADLAGERTVLLSTHIVEDVSQTCRNLAVLTGGRVSFTGTTQDVLDAARDHVWPISTPGAKPEGDFTVVSLFHLGAAVQYRVVGSAPPAGALPAPPSLEDGYVWLMGEHRAGVPATLP